MNDNTKLSKNKKTPCDTHEKAEWKGSVMLAPVPAVLVSCGTMDSPNIITVAWTGILCTQPPVTYVSVRPERYSHSLISSTGEFVINLVPSSLARECDFCGTYTGAKVNKWEKCHFTPKQAPGVGAPLIEECPVSLVCKVRQCLPLGSHDMFMADIIKVCADVSLLDENGKLHLDRASLLSYIHGDYTAPSKSLGHIGFSATKKKKG